MPLPTQHSVAPSAPSLGERMPWPALALLLITAAMLGGSNRGAAGDLYIHLSAVLLLAVLAASAPLRWPQAGIARAVAGLWLMALALPLLQWLPLPPALWTALPGRAEVAQGLTSAGVTLGWRPLNLMPEGSPSAWLHLSIGLAAYLGAGAVLSRRGGAGRLLGLILVLAVISVVLGLAQVFDGPGSALRFHTLGQTANGTGFFANRNHQAVWLAACFAPVAVWTITWLRNERATGPSRALGLTAGIGLGAVLLLGVALTQSRAGVVLGMLALLGSLLLVLWARRGGGRDGGIRWIGVSGAIGLLLALQFGLYGLLQRFDTDPLDDARYTLAGVAAQVARHYSPTGSGLGSFVSAYAGFEQRETTYPAFVNHAHNEYVEVWLEAGWPGLALLAGGVLVWAWLGIRVWRGRADGPDRHTAALAVAAWLGLTLLLLHSLVDYPLRTPALMVFAGVLLAQAMAGLGQQQPAVVADAAPARRGTPTERPFLSVIRPRRP